MDQQPPATVGQRLASWLPGPPNDMRLVGQGDKTRHCGGIGEMITASGNVHDNSPNGALLAEQLLAIMAGMQARDKGMRTIAAANMLRDGDVDFHDLEHLIANLEGASLDTIETMNQLSQHGGIKPCMVPRKAISSRIAGLLENGRSTLNDNVQKARDAIPKNLEDAKARAYNKGVELGNKRPSDKRPGPGPEDPPPKTKRDAAKAVGKEVATQMINIAKKKYLGD
jgi:hypothetical protein